MLSVALSCALNFLYALYHGVLGAAGQSLWFMAMFAFYAILAAMRLTAVLCALRGGPAAAEFAVMRLTGLLLVLFGAVLAAVIYISESRGLAAAHGEIAMIGIAAYTFARLTAAAVIAVRQRRRTAPLTAVIRRISCAEIAAGVLTMQRSMLVTFPGMSSGGIRLMNSLTGAGVCLFVMALGLELRARGTQRPR